MNYYYQGIDPNSIPDNARLAIWKYMGEQDREYDNDQYLYYVNNWQHHGVIRKYKEEMDAAALSTLLEGGR